MIIIQITGKSNIEIQKLESSGPKAGKTLYFWACIPHFGTDTVEKQGSGCIICAEKAILKDVAGQKNIQEETRL